MQISAVTSRIKNEAKKFSQKPLETTSKALGFASVLTVLYDSHRNGKENALVQDYFDSSERFSGNLQNKMVLYRRSQTIANAKDAWYNFHQTLSFPHIVSKIEGYVCGFGQNLIGNIPEIALSLIALNTKNHKLLGQTAGVLLGINAIKTFVHDVMGVGSNKE